MIDLSAILTQYLEGLCRLAQAKGATLYTTPVDPNAGSGVLLSHGDSAPRVLEDLQSAQAWAQRANEQRPRICRSGTALLIPLHSEARAIVAPERRHRRAARPGAGWVELRFDEPETAHALLASGPADTTGSELWRWIVELGNSIASHANEVTEALCDPLTGLPLRTAFGVRVRRTLASAADDARPFTLLFVNPIGFAAINDQLGTRKADLVVREIAVRLRAAVRSTDFLGRFGGVIFAIGLPDTDASAAGLVASKVRDALEDLPLGERRVRPPFALGFATCTRGSEFDERELIRRASTCLTCVRRRGGGIQGWSTELEDHSQPGSDRLDDVFTGNVAKDYRNMALLWRGLAIVSETSDDPRKMAARVSQVLLEVSRADIVRVFMSIDGRLTEMTTSLADPDKPFEPADNPTLSLSQTVATEGRAQTELGVGSDGKPVIRSVVPLTTEKPIGALYLEAHRERYRLDEGDTGFLEAFGKQLALALDRAQKTSVERLQSGEEKRQLKREIETLKKAKEPLAEIVYEAARTQALLDRLGRVAPTEATVLIQGPSGTGKELLARRIHELSPRREGPYVVVDCGAIANSVIESELFGHSRGAYTGAERQRGGRLLEAHGGTVFLDEIGELPLEVQSKLLRFVQERHFTPVGANSSKSVDVRIVAATNRDLALESRSGTFREDLFYRLSVFTLQVPALRDRPEDILPLARHFLARSCEQLGRRCDGLTTDAESRLLAYPWPGNVRELQNRILQALILTTAHQIDVVDLQLPESMAARPEGAAVPNEVSVEPPPPDRASRPPTGGNLVPTPLSHTSAFSESTTNLLDQLRAALGRAMDTQGDACLPYGTWLASDLLLAADAATEGGVRRGARRLGIPMTTYRRRLLKARTAPRERPQPWIERVQPLIERLVASSEGHTADLLRAAQDTLLLEVDRRFTSSQAGALRLGVSPPTYRRRLAALPRSA